MQQIEVAAQPDRLRALAQRFDTLRARLYTVPLRTGPEGVEILAPVIAESQALVTSYLSSLTTTLGDNRVTSNPDSASALRPLIRTIEEAVRVPPDLAMAATTALEWIEEREAGAGAGRPQNHAETIKDMGAFLDVAADRLADCSTACHSAATYLDTLPPSRLAAPRRTTSTPQSRQDVVQADVLTKAQRQALRSIAAGGVTLTESVRGRMYVNTNDHTRITLVTYNALQRRKLVTSSTKTSLYHGQAVTVTPRGHAALAALGSPPAEQPAADRVNSRPRRGTSSDSRPVPSPASVPRGGGLGR